MIARLTKKYPLTTFPFTELRTKNEGKKIPELVF